MLRRVLTVATMSVLLVLSTMVAPTQAAAATEQASVARTTPPRPSPGRARTSQRRWPTRSGKLALNLDIDNTSLQSHYDRGKAVPATLRLARYAKSRASTSSSTPAATSACATAAIAQLKRAGFPVDGLCGRLTGESLPHSKQRCRQSFVNNGYRLIANIGNRSTDFVGGNYLRAYRLPNYGGQAGVT